MERRINSLASSAMRGASPPDEEAEYKEFVEAVDVIFLIQSKARRFLKSHSS